MSNAIDKPNPKPTSYQCVKTNKFPFHLCLDQNANPLDGIHTLTPDNSKIANTINLPYKTFKTKAQFENGQIVEAEISGYGDNYFPIGSIKTDKNKIDIDVKDTNGDSFRGHIDAKFNFVGVSMDKNKTYTKGVFSATGNKIEKKYKTTIHESESDCQNLYYIDTIIFHLNNRDVPTHRKERFAKCYYEVRE